MTQHVAPVWRPRSAPIDLFDRTPGVLEFIPYGWSLVTAPDDNEWLPFDPARPHAKTTEQDPEQEPNQQREEKGR